jgi:hypothetical protein
MMFKLAVLVSMFSSPLTLGSVAEPKIQLADDEGDLNPQPLPPIAEEMLEALFG